MSAPKVHFMAMHEEQIMRPSNESFTGFRITKCGRLLPRGAVRVMTLCEQEDVTCYQCLLAGLKEAREQERWARRVERLVFDRANAVELDRERTGRPLAWQRTSNARGRSLT